MVERWTQEMENPSYRQEKNFLWILAGNWREFDHYRRLFSGLGFEPIYLSHIDKIRGVREGKFIRVGTWYDRRTRELDEILEVLRISEFEEIRHEVIEREEEERREYYMRQHEILYHTDVKPIAVAKGEWKIWGQEPLYKEEFITREEMTI